MSDQQLSPGERMQIQMEYAVPLLKRLQSILGEDTVLDALRQIQQENVERAATRSRGPAAPVEKDIQHGFEIFGGSSGLLDYEMIATDGPDVHVDVRRCAHAELMEKLDARELGSVLLCDSDYASAARSGTRLDRPSTIMAGGKACQFRFLPGAAQP